VKRLAVPLLCAAAACAGGPGHVGKYTPKKRDYAVPEASQAQGGGAAPGSLWRDGGASALLFTDARALRENDLVVVRIEEVADAKRSADTDLVHDRQLSATLGFLNASAGGPPSGTSLELKGGLDKRFNALGSTGRSERLTATVPALVRKVLPNGNLFIEGHRVVLVNAEEQHFYISGVVRPIDIDGDNSVKSSAIADAEIEFTGNGILTDAQRQGWAARWFERIWPF
jgi:flagellar L-ring protein precursor FlgH